MDLSGSSKKTCSRAAEHSSKNGPLHAVELKRGSLGVKFKQSGPKKVTVVKPFSFDRPKTEKANLASSLPGKCAGKYTSNENKPKGAGSHVKILVETFETSKETRSSSSTRTVSIVKQKSPMKDAIGDKKPCSRASRTEKPESHLKVAEKSTQSSRNKARSISRERSPARNVATDKPPCTRCSRAAKPSSTATSTPSSIRSVSIEITEKTPSKDAATSKPPCSRCSRAATSKPQSLKPEEKSPVPKRKVVKSQAESSKSQEKCLKATKSAGQQSTKPQVTFSDEEAPGTKSPDAKGCDSSTAELCATDVSSNAKSNSGTFEARKTSPDDTESSVSNGGEVKAVSDHLNEEDEPKSRVVNGGVPNTGVEYSSGNESPVILEYENSSVTKIFEANQQKNVSKIPLKTSVLQPGMKFPENSKKETVVQSFGFENRYESNQVQITHMVSN